VWAQALVQVLVLEWATLSELVSARLDLVSAMPPASAVLVSARLDLVSAMPPESAGLVSAMLVLVSGVVLLVADTTMVLDRHSQLKSGHACPTATSQILHFHWRKPHCRQTRTSYFQMR
jgi:hypothetical protein